MKNTKLHSITSDKGTRSVVVQAAVGNASGEIILDVSVMDELGEYGKMVCCNISQDNALAVIAALTAAIREAKAL